MTAFITLSVTHLELQELQDELGATQVSVEHQASDPDKAYDVGLVFATLKVSLPVLTAVAAWLWSQRKNGRIVEEAIKIRNPDGSTYEHKVKYKATDPSKAIGELAKLLRSLFSDLDE